MSVNFENVQQINLGKLLTFIKKVPIFKYSEENNVFLDETH